MPQSTIDAFLPAFIGWLTRWETSKMDKTSLWSLTDIQMDILIWVHLMTVVTGLMCGLGLVESYFLFVLHLIIFDTLPSFRLLLYVSKDLFWNSLFILSTLYVIFHRHSIYYFLIISITWVCLVTSTNKLIHVSWLFHYCDQGFRICSISFYTTLRDVCINRYHIVFVNM